MTSRHAGRRRWLRALGQPLWRGVVGVALVAVAMATAVVTPAAAAQVLPDPARSASLTIHCVVPTGGASAAKPVVGAEFTITRVQELDLSASAGWRAAAALAQSLSTLSDKAAKAALASAGYTLGDQRSGVTDANGTLTFRSLPIGLYVVEETGAPTGTIPVQRSVVSLPTTDPKDSSSWLYDVDIYPKATTADIAKTVRDHDAVAPGDIVSWTISASIPHLDGNQPNIDGYKITDKLDSRLQVKKVSVSLADGTALTPDMYRVDGPGTDNVVTVEFTPAGLAVLTTHATSRVIVVIDTVVNGTGTISNTALLYPNAASFSLTPGESGGPIESPPAVTKWGSITIVKVDGAGHPLAGAVFSVYRTEADARADRSPIALGGTTRFTVGSNGQLTLSPLRETSWADGGPVSGNSYYLAEITPPAGYQRLADPIRFQVDDQTSTVGVDLSITNLPVPITPATGGSVIGVVSGAPIAIALVLLVLAGGVLAVVIRRRKRG